ncbi:hypothetical protein GCM10011358_04000 [Sinisalibacter lacisalsi]|uniref:Uncharacterized protein n=1 Tax=Sinisalibacter lacisalsi TaxID=1526570 RepID=A0ABQ1QDU3_9RHOB|nr:hypothetical protein GCM10011358_04000 [Sinisalibacter lacisalsi]
MLSGKAVSGVFALSTQDFSRGMCDKSFDFGALSPCVTDSGFKEKPGSGVWPAYFSPGVPSNFFSMPSQQSM